jgi:hypothetical protein
VEPAEPKLHCHLHPSEHSWCTSCEGCRACLPLPHCGGHQEHAQGRRGLRSGGVPLHEPLQAHKRKRPAPKRRRITAGDTANIITLPTPPTSEGEEEKEEEREEDTTPAGRPMRVSARLCQQRNTTTPWTNATGDAKAKDPSFMPCTGMQQLGDLLGVVGLPGTGYTPADARDGRPGAAPSAKSSTPLCSSWSPPRGTRPRMCPGLKKDRPALPKMWRAWRSRALLL